MDSTLSALWVIYKRFEDNVERKQLMEDEYPVLVSVFDDLYNQRVHNIQAKEKFRLEMRDIKRVYLSNSDCFMTTFKTNCNCCNLIKTVPLSIGRIKWSGYVSHVRQKMKTKKLMLETMLQLK
jgi:hypothetical protein